MRTLVRWTVEQWFHAHPLPPAEPVVVTDVVVPAAWTAWVVSQAERFCQEAAVKV